MRMRVDAVSAACAAIVILALAGGVAQAQNLGSLTSKLGGSSLGNLLPGSGGSSSMGNVAGLLEYCVKNNYLGGSSGASSIAGKLLGKTQGGASNNAFASGIQGILHGKNGQSTNLNSIGGGNSDLKSKLVTKACGVVLKQGKSFLGGAAGTSSSSTSTTSKLESLLGH
ncbi:DUF2501 domain-containing protein [Dyella sp. A6]|uniref:DUF2501 domain-containing protein n=1 Tax=Dyella aluminiiresistens TaxID=3069105 RepID=UPI002E79CFC7|nr:DUF2501 domain-containing protein [Dyella sp. A6]